VIGIAYFFDPKEVVRKWVSDHPMAVIGTVSVGLWFRYIIWDSKKHHEKQQFMDRRPKVTIPPPQKRKKKGRN
jgi:hypothetical protein